MGRRHLLIYLLYTSPVRPPSSTIPFFNAPPPLIPPPFLFRRKGYSHESSQRTGHADDTINHERAPSTLEEFKRLEEEKASQGVASQTVEKAEDGFVEAAATESDNSVDSVKESFKEPVGVGNFHRTGDE